MRPPPKQPLHFGKSGYAQVLNIVAYKTNSLKAKKEWKERLWQGQHVECYARIFQEHGMFLISAEPSSGLYTPWVSPTHGRFVTGSMLLIPFDTSELTHPWINHLNGLFLQPKKAFSTTCNTIRSLVETRTNSFQQWRSQSLPGWASRPPRRSKWGRKLRKIEEKWEKL